MSCELPVCTGRAALGGKRRVAAASAACLLGAALFLSALLLSPANRGFTLPRCWLRGGGSPLPPQVAASEGPPVEVVIGALQRGSAGIGM